MPPNRFAAGEVLLSLLHLESARALRNHIPWDKSEAIIACRLTENEDFEELSETDPLPGYFAGIDALDDFLDGLVGDDGAADLLPR